MRGKLLVTDFTPATGGITPADAGKTYLIVKKRRLEEDHPRGCGENHSNRYADACRRGSPPRMRGKHATVADESHGDGITPADAGKT